MEWACDFDGVVAFGMTGSCSGRVDEDEDEDLELAQELSFCSLVFHLSCPTQAGCTLIKNDETIIIFNRCPLDNSPLPFHSTPPFPSLPFLLLSWHDDMIDVFLNSPLDRLDISCILPHSGMVFYWLRSCDSIALGACDLIFFPAWCTWP